MEKDHPINRLMDISMEHIINMVDVSKIIGQPISLGVNKLIIPISKVSFGFGAAGSEFEVNGKEKKVASDKELPFGGGSGGGVSISPYSFLIVDNGKVDIIYADKEEGIVEKIIDLFIKNDNKN